MWGNNFVYLFKCVSWRCCYLYTYINMDGDLVMIDGPWDLLDSMRCHVRLSKTIALSQCKYHDCPGTTRSYRD